MEHHLTLTEGNFGQLAHIVAFSTDGPRGAAHRPDDINDVDNLMLLCPGCHKQIDDHPDTFSRETLRIHKAAHEDRIKHVTGLGPDRKTAVLIVQALIGVQTVSIPFAHLTDATAPRYPSSTHPTRIDLTSVVGSDAAFVRTACQTIKSRVQSLLSPEGEGTRVGHLSVFAVAPIPLLIFLGRQLSSKVASDLFQRHRDTEAWAWQLTGKPVRYRFRKVKSGSAEHVALVLSLSGAITLRDLPAGVRSSATVYEITLHGTPCPTFLRQKRDLDAFRIAYLQAIAEITRWHGSISTIDLFPAIPAPVAVLCGRELLPKVHPRLRVFDYDRAAGGFHFVLET